MIVQELADSQRVSVISLDSFYLPLTVENMALAHQGRYNFDHPSAFDWELLVGCIRGLMEKPPGEIVEVPNYDFATHSRLKDKRKVLVGDVVVLEGILIFSSPELRDMMNMKIFVDTDDDLRLARRIKRDIKERGRTVEGVLEQYDRFVKPSFDEFVSPTKKYADVIIPFSKQNPVGIDLIVQHIHSKLRSPDLTKIYTNLKLMPGSAQVRALHTLIRNRDTKRDDFIFYSDRLLRLIVEEALGHLPFSEKSVVTPTGETYVGVSTLNVDDIVCVSVIRAGEAMEGALRAVIKDVTIGKLLIERVSSTSEPELTYAKLPANIDKKWVLLMDPIIATGKSVCLAICKLTSVGVRLDRILVCSVMCSPEGIAKVCKSYPEIRLITSEIERGFDANHAILPGIGDFADRYFGTVGAGRNAVKS
jgi:uridine kinase